MQIIQNTISYLYNSQVFDVFFSTDKEFKGVEMLVNPHDRYASTIKFDYEIIRRHDDYELMTFIKENRLTEFLNLLVEDLQTNSCKLMLECGI